MFKQSSQSSQHGISVGILGFLPVLAIASLCISSPVAGQGNQNVTSEQNEIVFSIPLGKYGVSYSDERDESILWGPTALKVGSSDVFWISDAVNHRIIGLNSNGGLIQSVFMPEEVVGISDFLVNEDGSFFVLDVSATKPVIWRISGDGKSIGTSNLTQTDSTRFISGLIATNTGELVVEVEGGAQFSLLATSKQGELSPSRTSKVDPRFKSRVSIDAVSDNGFTRGFSLKSNGIIRHFDTRNELGRAVILTENSAGIFVLVEEVEFGQVLKVDQTVWRFNPSLEVTGKARIPINDFYTPVDRGLAADRSGNVYALQTRKDGADVVKLLFKSQLDDLLLPIDFDAPKDNITCANVSACIEASTILANARAYTNNSKSLTTTNISGTCSGRTKPRYLSAAGSYSSVSYDWGGFDSVSGFNSAMGSSTNNKAGDINTAAVESCSRGVDCSGFVSRAWGLSTKYGTSTLPSISTALSSNSVLAAGDILNKSGSHVVLISSRTSSGVNVFEATTWNSNDRVILTYHAWSYFTGYSPRRYVNLCGGSCQ